MKRKPQYPTCRVEVGGLIYTVHLRVIPGRHAPHVGADSPRFLSPGRSPRAEVIRILRDGIDVTDDLFWFTRKAICEAAIKEATASRCFGADGTNRAISSPRGARAHTSASLFQLGGDSA